jgi:hypothetical protein
MIVRSVSRAVLILTAVSVAATLVTAQKIKVESQHDEKADFAALRTYGWLPSPPLKRDTAPDAVTSAGLTQEVLGPHIVKAVDRELVARGLTRIDAGEPDVQVVYYASLSTGMNTADLGSYYQYTTGWALPPVPAATINLEVYERGTVVIDLIKRNAKTAIWRGTVGTNVNQENRLDKRIARIDEAMAKVFERFPLRPARHR